MTQKSIFWATNGVGDGAGPYTQGELTEWIREMFGEGVEPNVGGALVVNISSGRILEIASGRAIVYGFPYEASAAENLTVPAAISGTTGHRVVLRADWTAQTVRLALKSASDGVSTPPAATQTPGTTYEITLATLTITTGSVITILDRRTFIQNNAVVFFQRQGGSATLGDWDTPGSSNYASGIPLIQAGSVTVTFPSSQVSNEVTITFPRSFHGNPLVLLTCEMKASSYDPVFAYRTWVMAHQAGIQCWSPATNTNSCKVHWVAIGSQAVEFGPD